MMMSIACSDDTKAGAGEKCGKPEDCAMGLQCGTDFKCIDPEKAAHEAMISKSKNTEIRMNEIKNAIDIYRVTHRGQLPDKLRDLTHPKKGVATLKDVQDDFGKEIKYRRHSGKRYDLVSAGPDGLFGTDDDIGVDGP